MNYQEGEIPQELGGFDVSDDDKVYEDGLKDVIQTEEQIKDPTTERLDGCSLICTKVLE